MSAVAPALLEARGVTRDFRVGGGLLGRSATLRAVDDVDLDVVAGEVLTVVGESGSGKTTLGRCLLGMMRPTAGTVRFDGAEVGHRRTGAARASAAACSRSFRTPTARSTRAGRSPARCASRSTRSASARARTETAGSASCSRASGSRSAHARRRGPHELSGGQRQRVAIAAALALGPDLIVADEPVSALDVLVQAQILNLICDLQRELGVALVFITHDLAVVEHIADRVAVMYLGRIVEAGPADEVLSRPKHPYTRTLIDAIPQPDPRRRLEAGAVRGEIPSPLAPPAGCHFHPRCPLAIDVCRRTRRP